MITLKEIERVLGKNRRSGNQLRFNKCPICGRKTKKNPCFSLNITNLKFYCHYSKVGGAIDWNLEKLHESYFSKFKEVERNSANEIKKYIKKFEKRQSNIIDSTEEEVIENIKEACLSFTTLSDDNIKYLYSRGISYESTKKILREWNGVFAIPITNGKHPVGIKYRSQKKELFSAKGSNFDYFINWQNAETGDTLYIVEGEIDLLTMIELGYDNTVSLPSGVSNLNCIYNQKEYLSNFKNIILFLDNDKAGIKCKNDIYHFLYSYSKEINHIFNFFHSDYSGEKDVNDLLVNKGFEIASVVIKDLREYYGEENYKTTTKNVEQIEEKTLSTIPNYMRIKEDMISELQFGYDNIVNNLFTGFDKLDEKLNGLQNGLYIIGGPSSVGKTTFLLNIAYNLSQGKNPVHYFSLEMSTKELLAKLFSKESKKYSQVDIFKPKSKIEREEIFRFGESVREKMSNFQIIEGNFHTTVDDIENNLKNLPVKPVVIVDYLQLLSSNISTFTDKQRVDSVVTELKRISKEFQVPVIAIASLNRNSYENSDLSSFKESGNIEYSADVCMLLEYACVKECKKEEIKKRIKKEQESNERRIRVVIHKNRYNSQYSEDIVLKYSSKINCMVEE